MKFESNHQPLLDRTLVAFNLAVADTLDEARRVAPVGRTGKYRDSLTSAPVQVVGDRLESAVGSPLSSAKAKEKGAYIVAKRAPYLAIPMPDGSMRKVKAVRLPARPVVGRAGPKFPDFMTRRLKEQT